MTEITDLTNFRISKEIEKLITEVTNGIGDLQRYHEEHLKILYKQIVKVKREVEANYAFSHPALDTLYAMIPENFEEKL